MLLDFSQLILDFFIFKPFSFGYMINKRSFETKFKYFGLFPDKMIEFDQVFLDFTPLSIVTIVYDVVEIRIFIYHVYYHPSIFDDFGER